MKSRDFEKKYALIIRSDISQIIFEIFASLRYKICQFDIIITFLNLKINKRIYITQPKRFK